MEQWREGAALIDYAVGAPDTLRIVCSAASAWWRDTQPMHFPPNPGVTLGSTQVIVAIHTGASFEMEWRDPDHGQLRRKLISRGAINVNRADLPVFHRWTSATEALVIALESRFVAQTFAEAFDRDPDQLRVEVGMIDPTVQRLATLCDREIAESGAAGRLYVESLATALVVHLFRSTVPTHPNLHA